MVSSWIWGLCLMISCATAATSDTEFSFTQTFSTLNVTATDPFSASEFTYAAITGQITLSSSSSSSLSQNATGSVITSTASLNATSSSLSQATETSSSESLLVIGGTHSSSSSITATITTNTGSVTSTTSSSAQPTNTVPCNGYPEFCNRKYSNITNVCSHNAAFVVKNNAASNQNLPLKTQMDDGVRMLEGETHWVNNTVYNCHTTCSLLNVGPWEDELVTVREWLEANPYDVMSMIISNSDNIDVTDYVPAIKNSGILEYVYTPSYIPQYRDQWPTLGEMILNNQRMVFYMDFNANQTAVPYILDQYTHIWQTPFSPTNQSFPCTVESPPHLNETLARDKLMYLANHNLNVAVDLGALLGTSEDGQNVILIPDTAQLNLTNGAENQFGTLEAMTSNCTADWGHPPSWLVVDYYEVGSPRYGSVFEVAARANNVTYNGRCCTKDGGLLSGAMGRPAPLGLAAGGVLPLVLALLFAVLLSM